MYASTHPEGIKSAASASQFAQFAQRGHFTAIGDSDSHGNGPRLCRTYVFAREYSKDGVLEALRSHRTVVYDQGQYFGDAHLIELAKSDGRLAQVSQVQASGFSAVTRAAGAAALLLVIGMGVRSRPLSRRANSL